ncbi:uncharacterized protein LOC123541745 [Mercenaria mercenaria]|uniref:uncharacterized protein LOC123541745 n=1 Tax=Mercenaria mercenaria TaxID=6596 RepID=UPI00234F668A|nr:uncharacterized protein LOC123541745 [Mercenaria mercenaria]
MDATYFILCLVFVAGYIHLSSCAPYENDNDRKGIDAVETPLADKKLIWRGEMEDMADEGKENHEQVDNMLENQDIVLDRRPKASMEPAADSSSKRDYANVSFLVYLDHTVSMSNHILRFNNVVYNYGGGYNVHTGVYTVPISGAYIVSFHLELGSYSYPVTSSLYVNSKVMVSSKLKPYYGVKQASQTAVLYLKERESMFLKVDRGNVGSSSGRSTIFTGVRLPYI